MELGECITVAQRHLHRLISRPMTNRPNNINEDEYFIDHVGDVDLYWTGNGRVLISVEKAVHGLNISPIFHTLRDDRRLGIQ